MKTDMPTIFHMFSTVVLLLCLLMATPCTGWAEDAPTSRDFLVQAEEHARENRLQEAEEALRKAVELAGDRHPFLRIRLARLHMRQGRPAEAIAQAEKALALAPSARWFRYDLAKFYLAGKQYNKAEDQLCMLLRLDPGFASAYAVLAELFLATGRHEQARFAMRRARLLGYRGNDLGISLPTADTLEDSGSQGGNPLFRFLRADTREKAEALQKELGGGRLFEDLARDKPTETAGEAEYGMMLARELPAETADSLSRLRPYSPPVIVWTGSDFRIMQRILPFHPAIVRESADSSLPQDLAGLSFTGEQSASAKVGPTTSKATEVQLRAREGRQVPAIIAALDTLEKWRKAWETANFEGYLATYSKNFAPPDGGAFSAWREKRRKSLSRPKTIRIRISDTVAETLPDDRLLVSFTQDYQSDEYRDKVQKSLILTEESGDWKIVEESVVKELPR